MISVSYFDAISIEFNYLYNSIKGFKNSSVIGNYNYFKIRKNNLLVLLLSNYAGSSRSI